MTTVFRALSISLLIAAVVVMPTTSWALTIQQAAAPAAPQGQAQQPERTYEGQLSKVDSTAKTITLKGTDDKEMTFGYTDTTQVVGADDGVQGLSGKTGSSLKVSYRDERGSNRATKIEVLPKK
jgi:hypothetical protein